MFFLCTRYDTSNLYSYDSIIVIPLPTIVNGVYENVEGNAKNVILTSILAKRMRGLFVQCFSSFLLGYSGQLHIGA